MKFSNLFGKEFRELMNKQVILGMILTLVLFGFMGVAANSLADITTSDDEKGTYTICNQDNSEFTTNMLGSIAKDENLTLNFVSIESDDYATELARLERSSLVIIPNGYGNSIFNDGEIADLIVVNEGKISFSALTSGKATSGTVKLIETATENELYKSKYGLTDDEISLLKAPVDEVSYTVLNGKTAEIDSSMLAMLGGIQAMPLFGIFFVLIMASQMIMSAISTEKIDKTLETLLSAPVSRLNVLIAKMSAALVAAFLNALSMSIGMGFYMGGVALGTAGAIGNLDPLESTDFNSAEVFADSLSIANAMETLGISIGALDFVLIFVQLFLSLAIGLAISLCLGALATDIKSVQTLTFPIMILFMIPFLASMFTEINELDGVIKYVIYAIPFTHSFTAIGNILQGDTLSVVYGLIYQAVFLVGAMFVATKLFMTDRLFTMSYNPDKKKKSAFKKPTKNKE